jgi:hypothetical protein
MPETQNSKLDGFLSFLSSPKAMWLSALIIPLVVGYFQYVDSYQFPKWKVFLSGVIMGIPFSLGIFLSTMPVGKRFRIFTSILIVVSALVRCLLLVPPPTSILSLAIDLYALWNLFAKRTVSEASFLSVRGKNGSS